MFGNAEKKKKHPCIKIALGAIGAIGVISALSAGKRAVSEGMKKMFMKVKEKFICMKSCAGEMKK